jgi:hypothetical protein
VRKKEEENCKGNKLKYLRNLNSSHEVNLTRVFYLVKSGEELGYVLSERYENFWPLARERYQSDRVFWIGTRLYKSLNLFLYRKHGQHGDS